MNEHSLPEDLSAWPSSPYQLLGVQFGVSPNDLRRAYTRLIRTYKPEQFPEQFRRIREAYEAVLSQVEFFRVIHQETQQSEEPKSDEPKSQEPNLSLDDPSPDPAVIVPRPWQPTADDADELDRLWQRACGGEEEAVYRRLVELHEAKRERTDVVLRLYWLLSLTPVLAPGRSPCSWLAEGLRAGGLTGPLWELYRREIMDNPEEAISERCTELLRRATGSGQSAGQLTDLAELRWQAATRLGNWKIIDTDMDLLHDRLARDDVEAWVRLVISAAEKLGGQQGSEAQNLVKNCQAEINRYPELHTRLGDAMDRLEQQLHAAAALDKLEKGARSFQPVGLISLIRLSLNRSSDELRPALMEYLSRMASDPRRALEDLDMVPRTAASVLAQFSNILVQFRGYMEEDRSRGMLAQIVQEFIDETEFRSYAFFRLPLMEFCNREAILPEVVAEHANNDALSHEIMSDWPLRCVCLGCYLFWK
jgi:hypothetical protein